MRVIDGEPVVTETPDESLEQTVKIADKNDSRRKCPLSNTMVKALVVQMGVEQSNQNLYTSFSNYYKNQGLVKLAEYYHERAEEEAGHMKYIIHYLDYNDAEYIVPGVERVDVDIKDRVFPFTATVDREIETSMALFNLADIANSEKDHFTYAWLLGSGPIEGNLIPENQEEEFISRLLCRIANEDCDWLTKETAIMEAYRKSRP